MRVYGKSLPPPRPAGSVIECYGCDRPVKHVGDVCRLCQEELGMRHVPPAMRAPNRYEG